MNIAYKTDRVTIYRGDCLEVMNVLPDKSVELLWTDPPFGHGNHDGDLNATLNVLRGLEQQPIANDTADEMRTVVDGMLKHATRIMKKESSICCCCSGGGGHDPMFAWVANRMDREGLSFFHSVIWDKLNPGIGWCYRRQYEMVMVAHLIGGKIRWPEKKKATPNLIRLSKPKNSIHPNEKPLELVSQFIHSHTARGDTVLDPFCGSGTTLVAAMNAGRRAIGIEIEEKWVTKTIERVKVCEEQGLFDIFEENNVSQPEFSFF